MRLRCIAIEKSHGRSNVARRAEGGEKPIYKILYVQVLAAIVPGMAIVFGIDKFISECRALTNIIGNGVATVVISWSEGEFDRALLRKGLGGEADLAKLVASHPAD